MNREDEDDQFEELQCAESFWFSKDIRRINWKINQEIFFCRFAKVTFLTAALGIILMKNP